MTRAQAIRGEALTRRDEANANEGKEAMPVFDLEAITARPYEERETNVFYEAPEFKTRIIELAPGGGIPACQMTDHVLFSVLTGEAEVTVNGEPSVVGPGHCLISPPATFSMWSRAGARLLGVQIRVSPSGDGDRDA